MFGLATPNRVYLASEPADMRKHHAGLLALAEEKFQENPFGGALFVFTNKARARVKMIYWDGTGTWVFAKRLEKGRFSWPPGGDVVFDWKLTRRHDELTGLIGPDYAGVLQSDGYEAYAAYAKRHAGVLRVGCWAHARRKFFEACEESCGKAEAFLALIGAPRPSPTSLRK